MQALLKQWRVRARGKDARQKEQPSDEVGTESRLPADVLSDKKEKRECVICYELPRSVVFMPCAHLCTCLLCSEKVYLFFFVEWFVCS